MIEPRNGSTIPQTRFTGSRPVPIASGSSSHSRIVSATQRPSRVSARPPPCRQAFGSRCPTAPSIGVRPVIRRPVCSDTRVSAQRRAPASGLKW